jgi:hypothetical protein
MQFVWMLRDGPVKRSLHILEGGLAIELFFVPRRTKS